MIRSLIALVLFSTAAAAAELPFGDGYLERPLSEPGVSAATENVASITAGSNGYLVTWLSGDSESPRRLYGRRYSADGLPQNAPFVIADNVSGRVSVASNGPIYLLLWHDASGATSAHRLNAATGEWIDAAPEQISDTDDFDVASNGTDFIAAWKTDCGGTVAGCVRAERLSASGPMQQASPFTLSDTGYHEVVRIASDGSDYLVIWATGALRLGGGKFVRPYSVAGVRLTGSGTQLDPTPILIENERGYPENLAVAWSGADYFVAWTNLQTIRTARVTVSGTVFEHDVQDRGTVIATVPESQTYPVATLTHNGNDVYAAVGSTSRGATASQRWSILRLHPNDAPATLFEDEQFLGRSLLIAPGRSALVFAYDRVSATTGDRRAFVAFAATATRHHAVARR